MKSRDISNSEKSLPYQYIASNAEIARRVADYLVYKFGHMEHEVAVCGLRVLHRTPIIGHNAERLRGYIDGLTDALCGVD